MNLGEWEGGFRVDITTGWSLKYMNDSFVRKGIPAQVLSGQVLMGAERKLNL